MIKKKLKGLKIPKLLTGTPPVTVGRECLTEFPGIVHNLIDLSDDEYTQSLTKNKSENKSTQSLNASACPTSSFDDPIGDELPDLVASSQIVPSGNNSFCQSFIPEENSNNIEVSQKPLAKRCGTHGKKLYFYCVVCQVPACLICKGGIHSSSSGHRTEDIQSLYDKKITKFTRGLENLGNDTGKLKSYVLKFSIAIAAVDEMEINTQEMVDKDLQRNTDTLKRMSEILRQTISYRCEKEKKRLVESERKYKKYKDVLEEDLSLFKTALSARDVVAAFSCYRKHRNNEIEQKKMITECCKSTQYQHLQVVYDDEALFQKILQQRGKVVHKLNNSNVRSMHRDSVNASTDSLDESLIDLSNDDEITELLTKNQSKHSSTCSLNTTEISKKPKEGEFIELLTSRKVVPQASNGFPQLSTFDGNLTDLNYDEFTQCLTKNKSENKSTQSLNASACPTDSFDDLLGNELSDLVASSQVVSEGNDSFSKSFIPDENSNNIEVSKKPLAKRCETHGKKLYFYCVVCQLPACLICKGGIHSSSSGHRTEDIQSLYNKKIKKFTRGLGNLGNDTGKLKSYVLKFSIAIAAVDEIEINTQEMVDKDLQRNIATLNRMSEILRQTISYRCEKEKKRLVESERKYKKYKDVLEEDLSLFKTAVSKCDVVAAFSCYRKHRNNEIEQKKMLTECCKSTQYLHLQVVYDDEALFQKILQQRGKVVHK